jgi:hypothetical protein
MGIGHISVICACNIVMFIWKITGMALAGMRRRVVISTSRPGFGKKLGAGLCLALMLGAAPARATDCPRSQIFWKSKKTCIDKAEAAKLGFYHGPIPKVETPNDAVAPAAETPAPVPSPDAALPLPVPPAAQPAEAPPPPAAPSPYGDLVIEEFARAK